MSMVGALQFSVGCVICLNTFDYVSIYLYPPGIAGLLFCILWYLFVFDSPSEHPFISHEERDHLEASIVSNNPETVSNTSYLYFDLCSVFSIH